MPPNYYTASAICQEDSRLLSFDGAAFNRLLEQNPALGLVIMRRIAEVISQRLRTIQGVVLKTLYHHDEQ
jgi:CRP-like cAMP-binding protein